MTNALMIYPSPVLRSRGLNQIFWGSRPALGITLGLESHGQGSTCQPKLCLHLQFTPLQPSPALST